MLQRYAAGDSTALDELVHAYQEPAFWLARHKVGNDEVAADVVQEAFMRVLRNPDLYDSARPFKAWFLQIVRNLSIDFLRRKKAKTVPVLAESAEAEPEIDVVEQSDMQQQIQAVLSALPDKYSELIVLRDVEGYGPDEIAEMMNADYSTTRWRIHQARKKFRALWLEMFGDLE